MSALTWDAILRKNRVSVHPAATLFPMMAADELEELARDIDAHNLTSPLCLWRADDKARWQLIDGRNRCAAMARLVDGEDRISGAIGLAAQYEARTDPWGFVVSANLHRRHLTAEKKREVIAALLKANPAKSDRAIAKETGASHHTVAAVREKAEAGGQIAHHETRVGSDGVAQPATKSAKPPAPAAPPAAPSCGTMRVWPANLTPLEQAVKDAGDAFFCSQEPYSAAERAEYQRECGRKLELAADLICKKNAAVAAPIAAAIEPAPEPVALPGITPERMAEIDRELNGRAPENRLFTLWKGLKPNTRGRCVAWIEEDCPAPFALLDDVHTIREAAAPFRAMAKKCSEAEIDQFVELTKANS